LGTIDSQEKKLTYYDYLSCLEKTKDSLTKKYAEIKNYSGAQVRFQSDDFLRKTKVYGIMVKDKEFATARIYLNALATVNEEEIDFKTVQNINLDLMEGDFIPFNNFSSGEGEEREQDPRVEILRKIGLKFHQPLSGYARSLYFVLTGERILLDLDLVSGYTEAEEIEENSEIFKLYPNPTGASELTITVPDDVKANLIKVFDMTGKISTQLPVLSETTLLNTANWTSGLYLLQVYDEGEVLWQTKFVKL
jgi:hypothetical protein